MGEANDPIAVLLPDYLGIASEFIDFAVAITGPASGGGPGRVLAFSRRGPALADDAEWRDTSRRVMARPGVELRETERTFGDILSSLRAERAQLLVLEWGFWTGQGHAELRPETEWFARELPCDLAIVKRAAPQAVRQILLPVRGGPQGVLTLRLAMGLAEHHDATITLLHVEQPGLLPEDDAAVRAQLDVLLERGAHPTRAQSAIVIADSVEAAIAVEAEARQITIMGASPGDPGTPLLLGPVAEAVANQVSGTLIIVKARE